MAPTKGCPFKRLSVKDIKRKQPFPLWVPMFHFKRDMLSHTARPPWSELKVVLSLPSSPIYLQPTWASAEGRAPSPRTCAVHGLESSPLHRGVRIKPEKQAAARSHHRVWLLAAAETAEDRGQAVGPIVQLQVVVGTFLVLLDLKLVKRLGMEEQKVRQGHFSRGGPPSPGVGEEGARGHASAQPAVQAAWSPWCWWPHLLRRSPAGPSLSPQNNPMSYCYHDRFADKVAGVRGFQCLLVSVLLLSHPAASPSTMRAAVTEVFTLSQGLF